MNYRKSILVMSVLLFSSLAFATIDQQASGFVLCKNKKDVRTIRILSDRADSDACNVTYSRGSAEQLVGSKRELGGCRSILKSIQSNLEASKWSCRSVQTARVVTSGEVSSAQ